MKFIHISLLGHKAEKDGASIYRGKHKKRQLVDTQKSLKKSNK